MDTKPGALGIEGLGDMSFGAHFCLFYETEQDLIETLAFYFNASLAKDDFCLWITSEPLEKASYAIRQAIPSADRYLEAGNLEIVSFRQWYLEDGVFDAARAIQSLERKLSQALQKGHKGMRILGDEASLSDRDWDAFSNYEAILDEHFANKPMSIVCAYSARTHNLPDILDVARTHRFIAAKRNGKWEILEAPELKHARVEAERFTAEHNELEDKVQERIAHLSRVNQALQAEIIERKQAQEALTESQLRLQVALQAAQIGTGEWDLSANQVTLSESLRQIYGFAPGTLTTTFAEFAERVHPEDRERFRSKLAEALANETDFGLDYRVVWLDGSVRWITGRAHIHRDELSKPTRIVGASMDITERKQAEEALHVSEARLQAAIDATDIVLWERDLLSGHIAWLGHHEKLLGFAPGELDDNTLGGFENRIHPEDIDGLRQMRQRALEERSEYSHEYRVFWRDESIHWLRAQGRFIYNEAGQPVRLYGVVLDTTERKRAEEEVKRQKEIFQKIFDNVPIAITFFDKGGRLLMVNRAWEQMFGWTMNELEERNLNPFVEVLPDPQERQRVYDFMAMGSWAWHESTAKTRDGRTINIWAASVQLSDGTGIGLAQDITEHKQAESELQKNKEILQKIFDNVPVMITMLDKNGRFILTNRDFEHSLGWRLGQLTQQSPDMLVELYPDPQARQAVLDFAERADGRWEDFKTRAKDGRMIDTSWAMVRLSDGSMIGVGKDNTESKRAEEALRKSERVLREAEELGHTGSWEQDLVTGEIFNTEENLRLFFGDDYSKGMDFEDYAQVVHPEDREYVIQRRAELLEKEGPGDIEYRVVWPDGSVHVIFGRATVVRSEAGQPTRVYGTNVDISERKRMEEALRESEAKLKEAEHMAHVGYWERDLIADRIKGSEEAHRIFGLPSPDVVLSYAELQEIIHPDDRFIQQQALSAALQGSGRYDVDYRVIHPDGDIRFVHVQDEVVYDEVGQPIRMFGTVQDITEGRRAEEAIRKSERLLREAEELGHTGSWEQDLVTGETFNSEANLRLFFGDDRSKGASFEDFIEAMHPADREHVLQHRAQLIAEGRPGDTEFRVVWPDGGIHVIHRRATVIQDKSGKAIRLYGTNVDITERKRAEQEMERQAARAETLARIAARLNKQLDLDAVIQAVCQEVVDTFQVSQAAMRLYDKKHDLLEYAGGINILPQYAAKIEPISPDQLDEFVRMMDPILVLPDVQMLPNMPNAVFNAQLDVRTVVMAELRREQELVGVLVLGVNSQVREFEQDELSLLKAISDQAAQAIVNAQLLKTAHEQGQQLRHLSARLLDVQEAERRALTVELHDRVGQNLTGLSINLQNLKASLSQEEAQVLAAKFDDAQALVQDTSRQIRDIMAELHLPELEDYGLAAALETYAERAAARGNLELIASLPDLDPPRLPSDVRATLFRAAQEAISNVLKHANATQLGVSLEGRDGRVRLKVEDNGQGFEPDLVSQKEERTWGLQIMQERIESIGGKIQIESKPGQGTRVVFEIERPL